MSHHQYGDNFDDSGEEMIQTGAMALGCSSKWRYGDMEKLEWSDAKMFDRDMVGGYETNVAVEDQGNGYIGMV